MPPTGTAIELTADDRAFLSAVTRKIRFRASRSFIADPTTRLESEFTDLARWEPFQFERLANLLKSLDIANEPVERKLLLMASIGNGTCLPLRRSGRHELQGVA